MIIVSMHESATGDEEGASKQISLGNFANPTNLLKLLKHEISTLTKDMSRKGE